MLLKKPMFIEHKDDKTVVQGKSGASSGEGPRDDIKDREALRMPSKDGNCSTKQGWGRPECPQNRRVKSQSLTDSFKLLADILSPAGHWGTGPQQGVSLPRRKPPQQFHHCLSGSASQSSSRRHFLSLDWGDLLARGSTCHVYKWGSTCHVKSGRVWGPTGRRLFSVGNRSHGRLLSKGAHIFSKVLK